MRYAMEITTQANEIIVCGATGDDARAAARATIDRLAERGRLGASATWWIAEGESSVGDATIRLSGVWCTGRDGAPLFTARPTARITVAQYGEHRREDRLREQLRGDAP